MLTEVNANLRAIAQEPPYESLNNLEETLKQLHCHIQKLSAPEVKQISKYQPLTRKTGSLP